MCMPVVTIGYIENEDGEFNTDSVNSLIAQTYSDIEVIISVNYESKLPFGLLFSIIENGKKENIISIKWHISPKKMELCEHMEYISDQASGNYVTFLLSNDSFYETSSLEVAMQQIEKEQDKNAWWLKTVVFTDKTFSQADVMPGDFDEADFSMNDVSFIYRTSKVRKKCFSKRHVYQYILTTMWKEMQHSVIDKNYIREVGHNITSPAEYQQNTRVSDQPMHDKFRLNVFSRKKIKLLFLANEYCVWPSLKSIYTAALKSRKFEVKLVYVPFGNIQSEKIEEEINEYKEKGYLIERFDEFDLDKYHPDILFYCKPYDEIVQEYQLDTIRPKGYRIVYSTYAMNTIGMNEEVARYNFTLPLITCAWQNISFSRIHTEKFEQLSYGKSNYIKSGHPRFDLRLKDLEVSEMNWYHEILRRADGRKVIMWNTHHTIGDTGLWGCFLENWETMLALMTQYEKDIFFIWRPHPLLFSKLIVEVGEKEAASIKNAFLNKENIILDQTADYLPAFLASAGLISEISSLVEEALVAGKMIYLNIRKEREKYIEPRFMPVLYSNQNGESLESFCIDIINGRDNKEKIRNEFVRSNYYFPRKSRTVGEELLDQIYKKILHENRV